MHACFEGALEIELPPMVVPWMLSRQPESMAQKCWHHDVVLVSQTWLSVTSTVWSQMNFRALEMMMSSLYLLLPGLSYG